MALSRWHYTEEQAVAVALSLTLRWFQVARRSLGASRAVRSQRTAWSELASDIRTSAQSVPADAVWARQVADYLSLMGSLAEERVSIEAAIPRLVVPGLVDKTEIVRTRSEFDERSGRLMTEMSARLVERTSVGAPSGEPDRAPTWTSGRRRP